MNHWELQISPRGVVYTADCAKCGTSMYAHEFAHIDVNKRRDAMESGTLLCDECGVGKANPVTFTRLPREQYAGRYSAPGYLDCTEWQYDTNKRRLAKELQQLYGDES